MPHVQVAIGLIATHMEMLSIAEEALETWGKGLTERIVATPYLTSFPASIEDPGVASRLHIHRFRDPAADTPAGELPDFWDGDPRALVYVTFGSVTATVPTAAPIYGVALEAVAGLPARVLVTTGALADESSLVSPGSHVRITRWIPQADVLPHARVVVCHGGSGTTLGALAAAVPLIVTPLFADQPQNGRRVAAMGAGVVVEPRDPDAMKSAIDPADLRDAIATVLAEDAYRNAAERIAAEIRELPPADAVLTVLDAVA